MIHRTYCRFIKPFSEIFRQNLGSATLKNSQGNDGSEHRYWNEKHLMVLCFLSFAVIGYLLSHYLHPWKTILSLRWSFCIPNWWRSHQVQAGRDEFPVSILLFQQCRVNQPKVATPILWISTVITMPTCILIPQWRLSVWDVKDRGSKSATMKHFAINLLSLCPTTLNQRCRLEIHNHSFSLLPFNSKEKVSLHLSSPNVWFRISSKLWVMFACTSGRKGSFSHA